MNKAIKTIVALFAAVFAAEDWRLILPEAALPHFKAACGK